jgi:hypothetical protein
MDTWQNGKCASLETMSLQGHTGSSPVVSANGCS